MQRKHSVPDNTEATIVRIAVDRLGLFVQPVPIAILIKIPIPTAREVSFCFARDRLKFD
jgi:hypothetical protein